MSLPWIKVYADLPEHPKSLDLADFLNEPLAFAYIVRLWCWCSRFAQDGRVPRNRVEHAAKWSGKKGMFLQAAIASGFLEEPPDDPDHVVAHDWTVAQRAHLDKMERDRERQSQKRRETIAGESRDGRATVAESSHDGRALDRDREREEDRETESMRASARDGLAAANAPPPVPDSDAEVYQRWRELWSPRAAATPTPKRLKLIRERRKERDPARAQQDLLDSIAGWKNDPWQERSQHAELEVLLRDAAHVDKGLKLHAAGPPATAPKRNGMTPYTEADDAKHSELAAKYGPGGEIPL